MMYLQKKNSALVIQRPQDLSVGWAQNILNRHAPNAKVFGIKFRSMDIGTSTRLKLEVEHDSPEIVPSRWFIKTPSLSIKSRLITALPRFLHKEVNFYRSLSRHVPVKLPRVLAAESQLGRGSILVMSDLAESDFRPGQAADALSAEQAGQVIDSLARLHGHYWNDHRLSGNHRWLNDFSLRMENHMGSLLAVPLMRRGLRRADSLVTTNLRAPALRYASRRRHFTRLLASETHTLVHHDCHPGNIFWSQSGPGFLDWQLVRMGEGISDVAYFLATALVPEIRRQHEHSLINRYCNGLVCSGIKRLDEQRLFQRYRAHLVYPFEAMLMTLAIGGMMHRESNLELIRRTAIAADDHDSFRVIGA